MTTAYSVEARIEDPAIAQAWKRWLVERHLADVVRAGALSAELIEWPTHLEARYLFADAAAFARYEKEEAPRLRAEGMTLFPRGVALSRRVGEQLAARE